METERPPSDLPREQHRVWLRRLGDIADAAEGKWERATLVVDGTPTPVELVRKDQHWIAITEIGDVQLTIDGRRVRPEDVELVRITDVEPYIQGRRERRAAP